MNGHSLLETKTPGLAPQDEKISPYIQRTLKVTPQILDKMIRELNVLISNIIGNTNFSPEYMQLSKDLAALLARTQHKPILSVEDHFDLALYLIMRPDVFNAQIETCIESLLKSGMTDFVTIVQHYRSRPQSKFLFETFKKLDLSCDNSRVQPIPLA